MNRDQRILEILKQIPSVKIELKNNSAAHAGHVEHLGPDGFTGETHYQLFLVSPLFEGLSRIDRQRKINDLLKAEFASGLHALELQLKAPSEVELK